MNKRLFVSIPTNDFLKNALEGYKKLYLVKNFRWLPRENFHITVCFLGEVDETEIPTVIEKIKKISESTPVFTLEFSGIVFGPPGKSKRMVWGLFSPSSVFAEIVDKISTIWGGEEPEERKPIPHVTMARIKDSKSMRGIDLKQLQLENKILEVKKLQLQESTLSSEGASYQVREEFQLKNAGSL